MGIDVGGHDTDEKNSCGRVYEGYRRFLDNGGSTRRIQYSILPKIASLNDAKVDIVPDRTVNWFVDYNFNHPGCRDRTSGGNS